MAIIGAAIAVAIAGLLLAGVFSGLRALDREKQEDITRAHFRQIVYALSIYTQKHTRLPCPAEPDRAVTSEPFGAERGSGAMGRNPGSCSGEAELVGIVPFKALGLSERDVQDGWRRFITYRVKSSLADIDPHGSPPPKVHDLCRVKDVWVIPSGGGGILDQNVNPEKALFCCVAPDPAFDVRRSMRKQDTLLSEAAQPGSYQPIHAPAPPPSITSDEIPDVLAVVLVSHGPNGHGAFIGNGARVDAGSVSVFEAENADGDGLFISVPTVEADGGYFDDMVEWRSQTGIYSEVGGYADGCRGPAPQP